MFEMLKNLSGKEKSMKFPREEILFTATLYIIQLYIFFIEEKFLVWTIDIELVIL